MNQPITTTEQSTMYSATYSPDDNKLRLYAESRLDPEIYARIKAAGFRWAPKQGLFFAPAWTPAREAVLLDLAGEIGDDDTSLLNRAEERADRFDQYSENRAKDAQRAYSAVESVAGDIPMGQPLLIGHHSEKRARRDAETITRGMQRAVAAFKTSEYWKQRAAGAIRHAKYKEQPAVRARRIKKLEAEKRKHSKELKKAETLRGDWARVDDPTWLKRKTEGAPVTNHERALFIATLDYLSHIFTLAEYPRDLPASQYEGSRGLHNALKDGTCTAEQAQAIALHMHGMAVVHHSKWLDHLTFRLEYERAMLGDSGGIAADQFDIEPGGHVLTEGEWVTVLRVNRKGGDIVSLSTNRLFVSVVGIEKISDYRPASAEAKKAVKAVNKLPPLVNYPGEGSNEITKKEWTEKRKDYKRTYNAREENGHGRYRYRVMLYMKNGRTTLGRVFITDQKRVDPPKSTGEQAPAVPEPQRAAPQPRHQPAPMPEGGQKFLQLESTLKAGVKTVTAPQLFPTPNEIAAKMRGLLDLQPGQRVLEPSAGTGRLVAALGGLIWGGDQPGELHAVEISPELCASLQHDFPLTEVHCCDFLSTNGELGKFDRIIMNPPFANGADIKHINHARAALKPGGLLVALCANGPRQNEQLKPLADYWEPLPVGSFAESGTGVNVAMLVIEG